MNTSQIAKLSMYKSIIKCVEENLGKIGSFPELELSFELFKTKTSQIIDIMCQENQMTHQAIAKRTESKQKLCKAGADIEILLKIISSNDSALVINDRTRIIFNELFQTKEYLLSNRLKMIHENAIKNLDSLLKYGITTNLLDEFEKMIARYFHNEPTKKLKTINSYNTRLKNLFRETDVTLKEGLDRKVKSIKELHSLFFIAYTAIRNQKYLEK